MEASLALTIGSSQKSLTRLLEFSRIRLKKAHFSGPILLSLGCQIPLLPSFLAWIEIDAQVLLHFLYYITSIRGVLARKLKLPFELVFFIR